MYWTNALAAIAVAFLAAYTWRHAGEEARDEAAVVGAGSRWTRFREIDFKAGSLFLLFVAVGFAVIGIR